ncbi:hypothetical protein NHX12_028420 [Muraenolepis orangiensis]|uniref:Tetratricopeptide repeat protein 16 n=1 Tax=Muraenolepis orangiensis TaxID=630683 RepID=A0A9Q0ED93_9TELE|nr:hypothetical protein NHX12_028420 [Muraenolepis orangiensis]
MDQGQYEKAVRCFSKAIILQPNQAQLYSSQGEAYLILGDFQSAAGSYQQACRLESSGGSILHTRLSLIYHLQGQCLFDGGLYLAALESFSKAAELNPQRRAHTLRSLACLSALGRYRDCLRLVSYWLAERPSSDLYVLRARLYKRLGRPAACYHDNRTALLLEPASPVATALRSQLRAGSDIARQEAVDHALAGRLPRALAKITSALTLCPQEPRHYLLRGILHRRMKDFTSSIDDLVQALVLTYNDFGVRCSGRCLLLQGQWGSALSDCQQAEVLNPGDQNTRTRLASLHHNLGVHHYQHSKAVFYQNRSRTCKILQDPDLQQLSLEDALRTLVLDPENQEVLPLVLSHYPGCSAAEVMSGPDGVAVRARLLQTIGWQPSAPRQPSTGSDTMTLANESADRQADQSKEDHGKPCVGQSELRELVTRRVQMKQAVRSFLSHRLPLHQPGPSLSPP